ncbi:MULTISPECIES: DUF305 domain-containing protein [Arthrobacter]|uniref:DUF305 domain-containing protein n=1 Tax=Arthrobacter terricola TaxID=2547396 RepID=A0A4R5KVF0_9MICC|nr:MULTISPECIES: DUF305 domain-containing protein [Arthrobacter]MBT8160377.1 DUF305 domain-containing protein [Arthrobacter sp. GN70]TDF99933.1 DUF305 domain-containing protein [Arthrobacter terricola]
MKKNVTFTAVALAAAIGLAGCASGSDSNNEGAMSGMNHQGTSAAASPTASATASGPAASTDRNAADVAFAQMMIPHHTQAVHMSDVVLAKKDIPLQVSELANRIKAAQGPEIEKMQGWLKAWNQPAEMAGSHDMDGMMSDSDMKALDAAQGAAAAKLYLTQMIAHHEGAVAMAKAEIKGGTNADALALGKDIVSAQQAEIAEMQGLLKTL